MLAAARTGTGTPSGAPMRSSGTMFREPGRVDNSPADGSAYAAGHAGPGVAGHQTGEFDNPRITPYGNRPPPRPH